jgi:O-antigen ligase
MLNVLLILIFIRPFISSLAAPYENLIYSILLLGALVIWITVRGLHLDKIRPIRYPLMLFILALAVSLIFSRNITISVQELYKYVPAILLLAISISLSSKEKKWVILCIVLAGLVISFRAIYQYFFGFQNLLSYVAKKGISDSFVLDYISRKRPFYPFVTPNVLAGYLSMIIPLTFIQKYKWWLIIPLSSALLLTRSLGALLSIFLGVAIYFYLKGDLKKRGILFLAGLLIIIAGVLVSRNVAQKLHTLPVFSAVMRLSYWQDTLGIIKAHPWTGVGLGNFNLIQSRYAHNSYLQIWAEMGILGIVSFIWLIIAVLKESFQNLKDSASKNKIAGLISASAVFLLHNFVDFSFFLPEASLIWWVIFGLFARDYHAATRAIIG